MKTSILSTVVALTLGLLNTATVQADHVHGPALQGSVNYGYRDPYPHSHHHHGYPPVYGGYGYVRPYAYPVVVPPPPAYVYPAYPTYYQPSGVSLYGKNFGFSIGG